MSFWGFILLLIIAAICGAIGQRISGYSLGGCFISIIVGFIGALLGKWMATELDLPVLFQIYVGDKPFPVIWAIVGSTLFAVIIGILTRKDKQER